MRVTGMVMTMGEVSVVQEKSPAAKVGIKVRDKIVKIDDQPIADPMKFPEQVSKRAGDTVKLNRRSRRGERSVGVHRSITEERMGGRKFHAELSRRRQ